MKVYKQSWRGWLGRYILVSFFLGAGVIMLFFLPAVEMKALGLFSLLMGIYISWLSTTTRESFVIRVNRDAIVFPSFTWWGQYIGKKIPWKDVLAVYTLSEYSSMETYVIPALRTGDKDFDREINHEIKRGKEGTKTRKYLDYLKRTAQIWRVPRGIINYQRLLKDICTRAGKASIDEDTKRRAQGKEPHMLLSDRLKKLLRAIFQGVRDDRKRSDTSTQKKLTRKTTKRRPIVFIDKPAHPSWLILISLFSFVIGGLLACRNYLLLGKPKKYGVMGIVIIAGLIVAAVVYFSSTSDFINALIWINLMAGGIMAFLQHPDYIEWEIRQSIKKGKPRKKYGTRKKKKAGR
jgi:hypothetical protein